MRKLFIISSFLIPLLIYGICHFHPGAFFLYFLWTPIFILGIHDITQTSHTILRNFPLIGHFRYLLEMIRPEISQYFIESNSSGTPLSREQRSLIYQRSKKVTQTLPFGTQKDVYAVGYEWMNHTMIPLHKPFQHYRITIGGPACKQPYKASLLNISAMSYGSLSKNAILALSKGAKMGGFFHNTGEGGLSPYHLEGGGDIVWQLGTGYFGCRTLDGKFCPINFKEKATLENVKMIEIKLSQGAKPGHGGILPVKKLTAEIASIRGVPMGKDVLSPPGHSTFSTPLELLDFVEQLRNLSGGKPIGIKLCLGSRREFIALCKAMVKKQIMPDYFVVDGGEGGTGAAPLEFSNSIGFPLKEGLIFVHNALVGFSLRKHIKIIASGKVVTGFDIVSKISMGADICNSARAMMMALGCIQALRCNTNDCPTGVASQKPSLVKGLVVSSKAVRVNNFHEESMKSAHEIIGAIGLESPEQLRPYHLIRRTENNKVKSYQELYEYIEDGSLLGLDKNRSIPESFASFCSEVEGDFFPGEEKLLKAQILPLKKSA